MKMNDSMDIDTKVKILKRNGFEEVGLRKHPKYEKYNFLVRVDEKGDVLCWYSKEYIRNTDIDKILAPFNSHVLNNEIEWEE